MKVRSPYTVLLAVFVVSRAGYYLAGVRFDARPVLHYFQFIDPELLKHRLLESLFYLHVQPPGFNLFAGVVLKSFPVSYTAAFHIIHLLLGAGICALTYHLMSVCRVGPRLATALAGLFTVSPAVVLFENYLLYEYLVAFLLLAAAALLFQLMRDGGFGYAVAFFTALLLLVLVRNFFHLVYFLAVFGLVLYLGRHHRKTILLSGLAPLLVVLGLYTKNWVLFGSFSGSTWLGMTLDTITAHQLTEAEARRFVSTGMISPVSLLDAGAPLRLYRPYIHPPRKTGIPVLDEEVTSTGATNFNNLAFLEIQRLYVRDGLTLLRRYPVVYLRSLEAAWFTYFLPAGDFPFFDLNGPRIHALDRLFNIVVFGQFREAADRKELRVWYAQGTRAGLVLYTGLFLLIGLPLLWTWSAWYLVTGVRRGTLEKPVAILLGFLLFNIAFLTAVANLLSSFENNRYRFQFDAFFVVLAGLAIERLWNRHRL